MSNETLKQRPCENCDLPYYCPNCGAKMDGGAD